MAPVLEAVPGFSEGRDPDFLDEVVRVASSCGLDVLDPSMDRGRRRAVRTVVGHPGGIEPAHSPAPFERVESEVACSGGEIEGTEVIGMIPETLVLAAAGDRLRLFKPTPDRLLPVGVARHLSARADEVAASVLSWLGARESETPEEIQGSTRGFAGRSRYESSPSERA